MNYLYNDPSSKIRRRNLRNNQTPAEKLLWNKLRSNQLSALRFFRQYSVDPYILDFYCPKIRLAIELDGGQHSEMITRDEQRTEFLRKQNIIVLRFWNNDIQENLDGVVEKIKETVEQTRG